MSVSETIRGTCKIVGINGNQTNGVKQIPSRLDRILRPQQEKTLQPPWHLAVVKAKLVLIRLRVRAKAVVRHGRLRRECVSAMRFSARHGTQGGCVVFST